MYIPLRQATTPTNLSYYALRLGCLEGRFPFVRAGNRFLVAPEQILETLEREATENQRVQAEQRKGA